MNFIPARLRFWNPRSTSSHKKAIPDGAIHGSWDIQNYGPSYSDAAAVEASSSSTVPASNVRARVAESESDEHSSSSSTAVAVVVVEVTVPASTNTPPVDDCCPICFSDFSVPCRAPCGHWYCGGCIMQYWKYCDVLQPCKCPMCSRNITCLAPEASLFQQQQEDDVTEVLKKVDHYNHLFNGGLYGCFLRFVESPLYFQRVWQDLLDPHRLGLHITRLRFLAMVIGLLYSFNRFDSPHISAYGRLKIMSLFDRYVIVLYSVLCLVGLYLQHRRDQRARDEIPVIDP